MAYNQRDGKTIIFLEKEKIDIYFIILKIQLSLLILNFKFRFNLIINLRKILITLN